MNPCLQERRGSGRRLPDYAAGEGRGSDGQSRPRPTFSVGFTGRRRREGVRVGTTVGVLGRRESPRDGCRYTL